MMQLAVVDEAPFHTVYVHALVRDAQGRKMSKSLGNVIDPIELIDKFGADALRFTLTSMAAMGRDLRLSEDRVAGYRNFGTKIWNVFRFAEINHCEPDPEFNPAKPKRAVNKWIISETVRTWESVNQSLDSYRFNDAGNCLYNFVWGSVCDWYVEFAKPLLKTDNKELQFETRSTLAWVLDESLKLLHPIIPFITEELWGRHERDDLLIHTDWPAYDASELIDEYATMEIVEVIRIVEEIRSVRSQMRVPAADFVELFQIEVQEHTKRTIARNRELITRLARLSRIDETTKAPPNAAVISVSGSVFCIPLEGIIDVAKEKQRLQFSLDKIVQEIGGLKQRLANKGFLVNAPKDVVGKAKDRVFALEDEAKAYQSALDKLQVS